MRTQKERLEALPKWARLRIMNAEANAEEWKRAALSAACADPEKTDVLMVDGTEERGLPPGTGGAEIDVHHAHRQDTPGVLVLRLLNGGTLRIQPRVSNEFYVECTDPVNVRRRSAHRELAPSRSL